MKNWNTTVKIGIKPKIFERKNLKLNLKKMEHNLRNWNTNGKIRTELER